MVKAMRGQATFEFVIATVFFFVVILYAILFMSSSVSEYSSESRLNSLEARTTEISDYLVHINLTEEWPVLSYQRIDDFNRTCNNNYDKFLLLFDLNRPIAGGGVIKGNLKVMVNETVPNGNRVLADCKSGINMPDKERAETERFALSENNNIINIKVITW